jgi:beta-galactosidase GanA
MNWKPTAGLMCACAMMATLTGGARRVARPTDAEAGAAAENAAEFFPVSVWYSGGKARAPMLEQINEDSPRLWKEDLLKIKGLGFNTVRTWVEWNVGEPREGEYHLENLDLLLRLADEVALKVIVQVYVDSAPEGVGAKYPEGRYAAQDGQPIPSQAAPGFCFDNKNVRNLVLGFFREAARHAGKSRAFYGWDLWSEPAVLNWARVGFERYVPVEVLSSRELAGRDLQIFKLIVMPYPLMMTSDESSALRAYVENGGHLFVEARPGWVNEDGHAEGAVPGFGWTGMFGVRESSIDPGKEVAVQWGAQEFTGTSFAEHFTVLDQNARVVANFADGAAAAYEHVYGKGGAILLGTFAGQQNEAKPVTMHPLGEILAKWAGLAQPEWKALALVELREMDGDKGKFVFLFNHGEKAAEVEFAQTLGRPVVNVREIVTGKTWKTEGKRFTMKTGVPARAVRIYRIDY